MMAWIISSTVLMLVVIGLRTVLKGRVSLGLQYALWLLVLVRLLLPVNFTQSALSILGAAERVMETPPMQTVTQIADTRPEIRSYAEARAEIVARYEAQGTPLNSLSKQELREFDRQVQARQAADYTVGDVAAQILKAAWIAGMAVTALCLLGANLRFALRLRRSRRAVPVPGCALPVYVSGTADTPCLFGLVKPGIYLPADIPWDERAMEHILTHEQTHYRHGDHIWSVLRCVCLILHWYNPLVWICAGLSRRDGELACDEGSIRTLGEERRTEYGRTLIGMTCQNPRSMVGLTATTMNYSKKSLKERITLIARHPKTAVYTLILVVLVATLAVGCTFTGVPDETQPPTQPTEESVPDRTEPPTQPATEWETTPPTQPTTDPPTEPYTGPTNERLAEYQALFDWGGDLMFNLAAGHPYSRPEDVDLTWLFYGGVEYPGSWDSISEADRDLLVREGFWPDLDIQITPAELLDEALRKYFAVGLADVKIPEGWVYSPASDTYYSNHNDAYINMVTVLGYDDLDDGTVRLRLLVDYVVDGKDWYSNATMFMTLRPTAQGYQIVSNEYTWVYLGTVPVWRDPEDVYVYPFTDYALDSAIRLAEIEAGAFGADALTFRIEDVRFDPMSTDHAVLTELYGGNPTGMSYEDLFARRICLAVTYSATYDYGEVNHGQMLVTLARPVDTGVWYCKEATVQPESDYPARLLGQTELESLAYLGEDIVAAYRSDDGVYDYWIFVKHPGTGRILCIRE